MTAKNYTLADRAFSVLAMVAFAAGIATLICLLLGEPDKAIGTLCVMIVTGAFSGFHFGIKAGLTHQDKAK